MAPEPALCQDRIAGAAIGVAIRKHSEGLRYLRESSARRETHFMTHDPFQSSAAGGYPGVTGHFGWPQAALQNPLLQNPLLQNPLLSVLAAFQSGQPVSMAYGGYGAGNPILASPSWGWGGSQDWSVNPVFGQFTGPRTIYPQTSTPGSTFGPSGSAFGPNGATLAPQSWVGPAMPSAIGQPFAQAALLQGLNALLPQLTYLLHELTRLLRAQGVSPYGAQGVSSYGWF